VFYIVEIKLFRFHSNIYLVISYLIEQLLLLLHGLYRTLSLLLSEESSQVRNSHVSLSERSTVQFSFKTRLKRV
jgi:hypothetical protein